MAALENGVFVLKPERCCVREGRVCVRDGALTFVGSEQNLVLSNERSLQCEPSARGKAATCSMEGEGERVFRRRRVFTCCVLATGRAAGCVWVRRSVFE